MICLYHIDISSYVTQNPLWSWGVKESGSPDGRGGRSCFFPFLCFVSVVSVGTTVDILRSGLNFDDEDLILSLDSTSLMSLHGLYCTDCPFCGPCYCGHCGGGAGHCVAPVTLAVMVEGLRDGAVV